jgi:hypothetical protein
VIEIDANLDSETDGIDYSDMKDLEDAIDDLLLHEHIRRLVKSSLESRTLLEPSNSICCNKVSFHVTKEI